jgi:hypothetical protein
MNVGASVKRLLDVGSKKPLRVVFSTERRHRRPTTASLAPTVLLTPVRERLAPPACPTCGGPKRV